MGIKDEVLEFKRNALKARLLQITEAQLSRFKQIYPVGVSNYKLDEAIDLCDRTIKKSIGNRATGGKFRKEN